jgi:hypothetical protein
VRDLGGCAGVCDRRVDDLDDPEADLRIGISAVEMPVGGGASERWASDAFSGE